MKQLLSKTLLITTTSLCLSSGCGVLKEGIASKINEVNSIIAEESAERGIERVSFQLKRNGIEKALKEAEAISIPDIRASALYMIGKRQIAIKYDPLLLIEVQNKLSNTILQIEDSEEEILATINLAELIYTTNPNEAKKLVEKGAERAWLITSAASRARPLIRITQFYLETMKNAAYAKHSLEQTKKTIKCIDNLLVKEGRTNELSLITERSSHLLCR